jgi:chloride channel 3/4/5
MTYGNCCKGVNEGDVCDNWRQWDQVIGISGSTAGSFIYKYFLFLVTSLILASSAAILVKDTDFVKTSGIAEVKVIISGILIRNFLSFRTMVVKLVGLTLAVSSNMWAGKEGPLVHISCCCANILMESLRIFDGSESKRRELLLAASAAGISVAFNAPISGVIFTLEQLTSYFYASSKMWPSFVCAMAATVVLNSFKEGIDVYVTMNNQWLGFELVGFMTLGVAGGIFGAFFNRLNMKFANLRREFISSRGTKYEVLEVVALSLVTSLVTYPLIFPRLSLNTLISRLYKDCENIDENIMGGLCSEHSGYTLSLLFCTGVTVSVLTAYTFGTIVPAGVLTPALAIGAIFGRILGIIVENIQTSSPLLSSICSNSSNLCVSPAAYAVVGSAAFLAGVTKMTVWVVVTVFELTGALTYVLPIMITVLIARWTNDQLDGENCYDQWIRFFGYPYLTEVNRPLPLTKSRDFLKPLDEIEAIYLEDVITLESLQLLTQLKYQGVPILKSRVQPRLFGWLSLADLDDELLRIHAASDHVNSQRRVVFTNTDNDDGAHNLSDIVEKGYITLSPELPLPSLVDVFFNMKPRYVLFCEDGLFCSLLTLRDVSGIVEKR